MQNVLEDSYNQKWYMSLKNKLDAFIQSDWFILAFAFFTAFAWLLKIEYIYYFFAGVLATYLLFSQNSLKPILTIFAFFFMAFSAQDNWTYLYFVFYLACGIFLVTGIIYRFYMLFVTKTNFKMGKFLIPMLVAFLAVILGGLGYSGYTYEYHAKLIGICAFFVLIYVLCTNFIKEDIRSYVCKIFLGACIICVIEMFKVYLSTPNLTVNMAENGFSLGWINSVNLGLIFVLAVIMMLYKASKHSRFTLYYVIMAGLCLLATIFTFSKSALYTACIFVLIAWVYGYVKATRRTNYLGMSVGCVVAVFCVLCTLCISNPQILVAYKKIEILSEAKFDIYRMAIKMIFEQPLFGCGLFGDDNGMFAGSAWFIFDTPLNIIFSTGMIGAILFAYFYYMRFKVQTEYFSKFKMFALLAVLAFEVFGLAESALICIPLNILIMFLIVSCEKESELAQKLAVTKDKGETSNV